MGGFRRLLQYKTFCEGGCCAKSDNDEKVFCVGCNISSEFDCTSEQTRRRRNSNARLCIRQAFYVALLWTTLSISGMFKNITLCIFFGFKIYLIFFTCGDHMVIY